MDNNRQLFTFGIDFRMKEMHIFKNKKIGLLLLLISYFSIAYAVMNHFGIPCVFLSLFDIPCPGCGMTRAFFSVLRFDFLQALKYNVVIFFMPYVFLYLFFDFKHKVHKYLLGLIAIVALINWLIKIIIL